MDIKRALWALRDNNIEPLREELATVKAAAEKKLSKAAECSECLDVPAVTLALSQHGDALNRAHARLSVLSRLEAGLSGFSPETSLADEAIEILDDWLCSLATDRASSTSLAYYANNLYLRHEIVALIREIKSGQRIRA